MEIQTQRQRKPKDPCLICFLRKDLCICELIPSLELKTNLTLIIHHRELKRTTNTGRLAIQALKNSDMKIRGLIDQPLDFSQILKPGYRPVLFYPANGAEELTQDFVEQDVRPIQLLVPDGNWRQASKIHYRYPELQDIPRVMLPAEKVQQAVLRQESKPEGMATLQAIALALGVLEGEQVKNQLLSLYQAKLKQTLIGRGKL